jgi:hypothetical protein
MTREEWLNLNPLKQWRLSRQPVCSQKLCALYLGVSEACVSFWEAGSRCPSLNYFGRLSRLCGISLERWLEWWRQGHGLGVEADAQKRGEAG